MELHENHQQRDCRKSLKLPKPYYLAECYIFPVSAGLYGFIMAFFKHTELTRAETDTNSLVRRRVTTILEETISNGIQMRRGFGGNIQSAMPTETTPRENTTSLNTQHAMPGETYEQPSHQPATCPITEQSSSSSSNPSGDEPAVSAEPVSSMEPVSVRKKGRYEVHDRVDQYLLLQVSKHVQTDTLELLAAHLGVSEEQYINIRNGPANPRVQALQVNMSF